ncbi:MAG: queuosine precursor transporter [Nanoarchaeota archaeon]|mgnify:CR=1 FL=1
MLQILLWIVAITAFTILGSMYARKFERPDALIGIYVAFALFSNIVAAKIAQFNLGFGNFFAPAAVIVFSVTFLITDIVNEKFGRKETQRMIFIAFLSQVAITFFTWLVLSLEPAPFWQNQSAFEVIFGQVPRIIAASWVASLISENLDAYIFDWFKRLTKGKHLWARNILSSLPAMALDSVLFVTIAFYGIQPIGPLILGVLVIKWLVGIVNIPFMYLNRWIMYRK